MEEFDLDDTHWDRITGYVSENKVDSRWILRSNVNDKSYGSLRIVSHPDLPPGHLRAIFIYVTSIRRKNRAEKMKTTEDFQIEQTELEIFSIEDDVKTDTQQYEASLKELQELFNVKVFE